jgi:hypothetical protein
VQRVTELEKQTEANQQRIAAYNKAIAERFQEGCLVTTGGKPDLEAWSELLETDPDFAEEFAQTFDNPDVPEADDEFDPDSYDSYLNMELALERDDTTPEFAKVTKVRQSHQTHEGCRGQSDWHRSRHPYPRHPIIRSRAP